MASNPPGGWHNVPAAGGFPERYEFRRSDYASDHAMGLAISFFLDARSWRFANISFGFDQAPAPALAGGRGQPSARISDRYRRSDGRHYAAAAPSKRDTSRVLGAPQMRSLARAAENLLGWPSGEIGRVYTVTVSAGNG